MQPQLDLESIFRISIILLILMKTKKDEIDLKIFGGKQFSFNELVKNYKPYFE
jgi:hypothetical protein